MLAMIINPCLGVRLRPKVCSWFKQSRTIRPSVKIAKDRFQLTIDVHNFNKDEIRVKARPEYVIIEGKQEKKTKRGSVMKQFVKKYRLPQGCSPQSMKSKLSPDGMLTITAPRNIMEPELPCETIIPILCDELKQDDEKLVDVKDIKPKNPCDVYIKGGKPDASK